MVERGCPSETLAKVAAEQAVACHGPGRRLIAREFTPPRVECCRHAIRGRRLSTTTSSSESEKPLVVRSSTQAGARSDKSGLAASERERWRIACDTCRRVGRVASEWPTFDLTWSVPRYRRSYQRCSARSRTLSIHPSDDANRQTMLTSSSGVFETTPDRLFAADGASLASCTNRSSVAGFIESSQRFRKTFSSACNPGCWLSCTITAEPSLFAARC